MVDSENIPARHKNELIEALCSPGSHPVQRPPAQPRNATNVLTTRLDGVVTSGLMERDGSGDYHVTDKGRELYPVLLAFDEWGNRWHAPDGPPGVFTHAGCGEPVVMRARCETHGLVPQAEVEFEPGPGSPAIYIASRRLARSGSARNATDDRPA